MSDSLTYTLKRPVSIRNASYSKITLRRPLVRDLIAAERQPGKCGGDAALIAICSDIPFGDFGYVDAADFRAVMDLAEGAGFFGGEPTTPDDSSPSSSAGPAGDSPSS